MSPKNPRIPPAQPETAYLSDCVTFGMHLHRTEQENCSIYYMDDVRHIKRMVVDDKGQFCDFPVVITEEFWLKELKNSDALKNQIRFRTSFEKTADGILVLWCVQPDGRYWEDEDGFGASSDLEIVLYSFLDTQGKICAPFRLYRLGTQEYYFPKNQEACTPAEPPTEETNGEKSILKRIKNDPKLFKEIVWIVTALGNAVILFIIGFMATEYDTYYGKTNPYSSVFEYMLDDIMWVFILILLVFNLITISFVVFLPLKKKSPRSTQEAPAKIEENNAQETREDLNIPATPQEETSPDVVEQLERLKTLLDNGTITKKEFKTLKEKILQEK